MRRVSIADLVLETGLSRATIDRVLNGRGRVHPRTRETVERTLARMMAPDSSEPAARPEADILLRLGKGMMAQLRSAWDRAGTSGAFHEMYLADEPAILHAAEALCEDVTRPLIITAKKTHRLCDLLAEARARGKRVITLVSDLAPEARDHFVGIDNRSAGQTAAFLIGRTLGDRPTTVGVVLGDIAFTCHEDREIGFRTGLRAHFPKVVISGEALGEDSAEMTREAVFRLLTEQPALGAIYNVGGGNVGLVEAAKAAGRSNDLLIIGHEVNGVTTPLLRDGNLDFAIAGDPGALLNDALSLATGADRNGIRDSVLHDFGIYTRFNLPSFGATG